MKKIICTLIIALTAVMAAFATTPEQEKVNREIFDKTMAVVAESASLPMGALVTEIAQCFLGTPYVAGTLEIEPEDLQIFLDQTDCILFVEMCTCLALTAKGLAIEQAGDGVTFCDRPTPSVVKADVSYETYCHNVRNMRYRLGKVDGYASRIHYTSEWLLQNRTNGILREFSAELGEEFTQHFSFMTSHTASYRQLASDAAETAKVRLVEQHLEEQKPYWYISQERLFKPEVISQIRNGDIITFISKAEGLDLAHVALAFEIDGEMHFIHASSKAMEVIKEPRTLAEYAAAGLRISRLADLAD